jgi:hypothetical protein
MSKTQRIGCRWRDRRGTCPEAASASLPPHRLGAAPCGIPGHRWQVRPLLPHGRQQVRDAAAHDDRTTVWPELGSRSSSGANAIPTAIDQSTGSALPRWASPSASLAEFGSPFGPNVPRVGRRDRRGAAAGDPPGMKVLSEMTGRPVLTEGASCGCRDCAAMGRAGE